MNKTSSGDGHFKKWTLTRNFWEWLISKNGHNSASNERLNLSRDCDGLAMDSIEKGTLSEMRHRLKIDSA